MSNLKENNMKVIQKHAGIDIFRLVFALLLVVGAHTYPLRIISEDLNFAVFHIIARIVVPFFLMITGYFVISKYIFSIENKPKLPHRFIKKTALIYAGATLLYLPVSIYAGFYSDGNIFAAILRSVVFDGTFYHLWYLPASLIGILIIFVLAHKFTLKAVFGITVALYVLGLLGDSYYGLTENIPVLNTLYTAGFQVFSFTRNGIFLTPVFLVLGALIAQAEQCQSKRVNIIGFAVSMLFMLAEGAVLRAFELPRHDSMYIFLLPCMYFLFQAVLQRNRYSSPLLRDVSMYIFILHPIMIIAVRGGARVAGLTDLFVGNNMVHYLAVCLLSVLFSLIIIKMHNSCLSLPSVISCVRLFLLPASTGKGRYEARK